MVSQKSHFYVSILGFNVLVIGIALLIWYYFTDFSVEVNMSPYFTSKKLNVFDENDISKLPWIKDSITKNGSLVKICTTDKGISCDYEIPPMRMYQINSVVEILQLTKWSGSSLTPLKSYFGWFEYDGRNYAIVMLTFEDYTTYIIYGFTSSLIGTLGIILIWKKLLPTYKQQPT